MAQCGNATDCPESRWYQDTHTPDPAEGLSEQAQIAQRALDPDLSESLRALDDSPGAPVSLTARNGNSDATVEVGDILDDDLLSYDEVDEGVRARGYNFLHEQRLAYIDRLGRSLTPEMEPLRQLEIAELATRVDAYQRESRWVEGNLLMAQDSAEVTDQDVSGGSYRLRVERENPDRYHGDSEPTVITQELDCRLEAVSLDTARHYQLEIEDFLRKEYGARAEVTVRPLVMRMTVEKRTRLTGPATKDRIDEEITQDRGSARLHGGATNDAMYSPSALLSYLDGHERIPAAYIEHARKSWDVIPNPGAHTQQREASGEKLLASDWVAAMQIVSANLVDGTRFKQLRDFTAHGRVSSRTRLAAELGHAIEEHRDDEQFADMAQQLRARLLNGPIIDRPDPEEA